MTVGEDWLGQCFSATNTSFETKVIWPLSLFTLSYGPLYTSGCGMNFSGWENLRILREKFIGNITLCMCLLHYSWPQLASLRAMK